MKRIYYLILAAMLTAGASLFLWSCDDGSDEPESNNLKYLSVSSPIGDAYSAADIAVIWEAFKRMDRFIVYQNGRFVMQNVRPSDVALSPELFYLAVKTLYRTNQYMLGLKLIEVQPNVLRLIPQDDPLSSIRLKGLGEDIPPPNSDFVDFRWYGLDWYLSREKLERFKASSGTMPQRVVDAGFPDLAAPADWYKALGVYMESFNQLCDNGVRIECWYLLLGPVSMTCQ